MNPALLVIISSQQPLTQQKIPQSASVKHLVRQRAAGCRGSDGTRRIQSVWQYTVRPKTPTQTFRYTP